MKRLVVILLLLCCSTVLGASLTDTIVVQITDQLDANGYWTDWQVQEVTWAAETIPAPFPADNPVSYDSTQNWIMPVGLVGYVCSFTRRVYGVYAVRFSVDGQMWSEAGTHCILQLSAPIAK